MADEKAQHRPPTKQDAAFWADLGFTLVREIVCLCGHVNKVLPEWHTGFFRAECGGCYEELNIHSILRTPDRTSMLFQHIKEDHDLPAFKIVRNEPLPVPKDVSDGIAEFVAELEMKAKKKEAAQEVDTISWDDEFGKYVRHKSDGTIEYD